MNGLGRCEIVIVNYRTPDLVLRCVESIVKFGLSARDDIVVVDNASPDDSYERLSTFLGDVRIIHSDRNAGFAAGVNLGVACCRKDFVLVLNPDTYFEDRSAHLALYVLASDPKIAIAGLDLVYPQGGRQYSARRFYSVLDIMCRRTHLGACWPLKARVNHHLMVGAFESGEPFEAEWVLGSGFLIRRDVFAKIGGMDEGYFLYMEDVDLCARLWKVGYRVVCVPNARLVHDHQRASAVRSHSMAGRIHLRSLMRFRQKFKLPIIVSPGVQGIVHS